MRALSLALLLTTLHAVPAMALCDTGIATSTANQDERNRARLLCQMEELADTADRLTEDAKLDAAIGNLTIDVQEQARRNTLLPLPQPVF